MPVSVTDFKLNEQIYIKEMNQSLLNTYLEDKKSSSINKGLSSADIIHSKEEVSSPKATCVCSHKTNSSKAAKKTTKNDQDKPEKKQKSLYKTELCRNWEETNHCRYGVKCQYAHGAADLRELDRHPKYKTQKCRTFHQTGACPYGARCTFRHFNLPGDALEMKNRDREEEEERQRELKEQQLSESKEDWFVGTNTLVEPTTTVTNSNTNNFMSEFNHTDDSLLLPSNAELLLPHELLFDLESPEKPARCPLRDYVNLPSFSTFQPHPSQLPQNAFFRPWLF